MRPVDLQAAWVGGWRDARPAIRFNGLWITWNDDRYPSKEEAMDAAEAHLAELLFARDVQGTELQGDLT